MPAPCQTYLQYCNCGVQLGINETPFAYCIQYYTSLRYDMFLGKPLSGRCVLTWM